MKSFAVPGETMTRGSCELPSSSFIASSLQVIRCVQDRFTRDCPRAVYRGRLRLLADATMAGWLRSRRSSLTSVGRSQLAMTVQVGRWKDHH